MAKTRLSEIYKSEKEKGGGITSTLGKGLLEKIDPRKFFNQEGLLATAFPSLFKAYRATSNKSMRDTAPSQLASANVEGRFDTLISVTLAMAKDINITKQNIVKLVKNSGMTPAKRADSFFAQQSAREKELESNYKKPSAGKLNPTGKTEENKGGFLSNLLGNLGGGLGKGLGLAALGIGIGGFLIGLSGGGAAAAKLGGAKGVKDILVSLGEGLSAFSGQGLLALGALLGTGMLFGAYAGKTGGSKTGAMLGIGAIGAGIGLFFAGLSAGGTLSEMVGSSTGVKDMLVNLATGLNAFNAQSLVALGSLLGTGMLFGAVGGPAAALYGGLGIAAVGAGIAGFMLALSGVAKIIQTFGGSEAIRDLLKNTAEGLNQFSSIDGKNLLNVGKGAEALGESIGNFYEGLFGRLGRNFKEFIFGKQQSPLDKLATDLHKFDSIDGQNLSNVGQGVKDLASGLLGLAKLTDKDLSAVTKASLTAAQVSGKMPPSPTSTKPATASSTKPTLNVREQGNAQEALDFFVSKGWTQAQAAGIVGNLITESRLKTDAIGDNGQAYGIAQWHPDRQQTFQQLYGKPIQQSNFKEQLDYINWELNHTEKKAGAALRTASTADQAAALVDKLYERSSGKAINQRVSNAVALVDPSNARGSMIASASSNINDEIRNTMRPSGGNNTIVNSPTTNIGSGGNKGGNSASVYDTDMINTLMGRQYA